MAGHRRIATRLFLRYRTHPAALAVLLSIDLDAARGRIGSARSYARLGHIGRALAARLLEEYATYAHELAPVEARKRERAARPQAQRELRLLAVSRGKAPDQEQGHDEATKAQEVRVVGEDPRQEQGHEAATSEIQSLKEESAHAREPESDLAAQRAIARRRRAARALVRREGGRYLDPQTVEDRAAALGEDQVEAVLAELEASGIERARDERLARRAAAQHRERRA